MALREMEGVNKLIEFIGRPEFNDLHVYAVTVLSNCLEDFETMEVGFGLLLCHGKPKMYLFYTIFSSKHTVKMYRTKFMYMSQMLTSLKPGSL